MKLPVIRVRDQIGDPAARALNPPPGPTNPTSFQTLFGNTTICSACVGVPYSSYIIVEGLGQSLTWTIESGTFPTGLNFHGGFNTEGRVLIDGTPIETGNFSISVKAINPEGDFDTIGFAISIMGVATTALDDYQVGTPYSFQMTAAGGSGNYSWEISDGVLPDGLEMSVTGLISGTATGSDNGTQPITFRVIDLGCEVANKPFFKPKIALVATSQTKIATVLGYDEFIPSSPPKRYHTATWAGHSEQQLWVGGDSSPYTPPTPTQIGGARYDYSGFDHIDTNGMVDSAHVKNYSVECNGDAGMIYSDIIGNDIFGEYFAYTFRGYYGLAGGSAPNFLGHPTVLCGSPSLPYAFIADVAVAGTRDKSDLWGSSHVTGSVNLGISNYAPASSTVSQSVESGTNNNLVERYLPIKGLSGFAIFPPDYWIGGTIIYDNNYSCTLSDEYTDAEAMANAATYNGNSKTAENFLRTTGFITRVTTVNFVLACTGLVVGASYIASVTFGDLTDGTSVVQDYPFTATSDSKTITDSVPTPPSGHSTVVRTPTIVFA
jgi:hypothetical protein